VQGVLGLSLDEVGRLLVAGYFSGLAGVRLETWRVVPRRGVDSTFDVGAGANGTVADVAIQSDGDIIIAGSFSSVGGVARGRIARLQGRATAPSLFSQREDRRVPRGDDITLSVRAAGSCPLSFSGQRMASCSRRPPTQRWCLMTFSLAMLESIPWLFGTTPET